MIKKLLYEFMARVEREEIEVYNEFSLQHELGIFLREQLPGYKVQFERNTKFFGISGTIKHEIDVVVFNDVKRYAVELKYLFHCLKKLDKFLEKRPSNEPTFIYDDSCRYPEEDVVE